jgi:hypothetical protein
MMMQLRSFLYDGCQDHHRKVEVIGISLHKLSNQTGALLQEILRLTLTMVHRSLLHAVQLDQLLPVVHNGNEVRVALTLNLRLPLLDCFLVVGQDLLAILEELSTGLRVDTGAVGLESIQVGPWSHQIRIFGGSIKDYVEEGNGAACVSGILPHEEEIFRDLFRFELMALGLLVLLLDGSFLIEEEYADSGLGDHLQGPLFSGEHFGEGVVLSPESHLLDELVDDFGVRLQRLPVLLLMLSLHGYD